MDHNHSWPGINSQGIRSRSRVENSKDGNTADLTSIIDRGPVCYFVLALGGVQTNSSSLAVPDVTNRQPMASLRTRNDSAPIQLAQCWFPWAGYFLCYNIDTFFK